MMKSSGPWAWHLFGHNFEDQNLGYFSKQNAITQRISWLKSNSDAWKDIDDAQDGDSVNGWRLTVKEVRVVALLSVVADAFGLS